MKQLKTFLVITALMTVSCKKNDTGGSAIINVTATHHGKRIPFTSVYIKYGAKEFPGFDANSYTTSQMTDAEAQTSFQDLRPGDYYLYAVGYDSAISASVKGGIGVSFKWKERKNEVTVELPITE